MAEYRDYTVAYQSPAQMWQDVAALLTGAYSVEVIPSGNDVILRVWASQHCAVAAGAKAP